MSGRTNSKGDWAEKRRDVAMRAITRFGANDPEAVFDRLRAVGGDAFDFLDALVALKQSRPDLFAAKPPETATAATAATTATAPSSPASAPAGGAEPCPLVEVGYYEDSDLGVLHWDGNFSKCGLEQPRELFKPDGTSCWYRKDGVPLAYVGQTCTANLVRYLGATAPASEGGAE